MGILPMLSGAGPQAHGRDPAFAGGSVGQAARATAALPPGALFRLYLAGYLIFRFFVEFIKPREPLLGSLSAIQLASLAGTVFCLFTLRRLVWPIGNRNSKSQN
jgi:prolipoprotein diacylglyceryltransferase